MRGFFHLKRLAHIFINRIFYFIAFAIGFVLGGGTLEKITTIFNSIFNL